MAKLRVGPIPFDPEEPAPPMTGLDPERDALMALVKSGAATLDSDLGVIRLARHCPADKPKGYAITPAMQALRDRKLRLGR